MRPSRERPERSFPLIPLATALLAGMLVAAAIFIMPKGQSTPGSADPADTGMQEIPLPLTPPSPRELTDPDHDPVAFEIPDLALDADLHPAPEGAAAEKPAPGTTVVVKRGDTLSVIFDRLGIYPDLARILKTRKDRKALARIYPGQKLLFSIRDQRLERLELVHGPASSLVYLRNGDSFTAQTLHRPLDKILQFASGNIDSSLYLAAHRAGMSDTLIQDLVHIFRWDIDFAHDLRVGDRFAILYEKLLLDGEDVGDGEIAAAEFVNKGITYRAYRYTDENGYTDYYTLEGESLHKTFLRTPVELARISSYFNPRRRHPILNVIRAHKGIDYAAPTGTPIKATGAGRVIYRGTKGQYGKTIVLRHGNIYTTLYAHMSKYARGTGIGHTVRQGQTIGYVGNTGLSTGPHLHYEFRVNGVHRNPLKVKLPQTKSLPEAEMDRFLAAVKAPARQFEAYAQNRLALQGL